MARFTFQKDKAEYGDGWILRDWASNVGVQQIVMREEAIELRDLLLQTFPLGTPMSDEARIAEAWQDTRDARERRERIATAVLAGMLAQTPRDPDAAADEAIQQAEIMIAALDKPGY